MQTTNKFVNASFKRSVRIGLKSISVLFISKLAFVKFVKAVVEWGNCEFENPSAQKSTNF